MLLECLISILAMMVILCILVGLLGSCGMEFRAIIFGIEDQTNFNQLRMLFENDIFVRRRSKISVASNGKNKFCLGFWEYTQGELKYLIYDFQTRKGDNRITRFTRNTFNQSALTEPETAAYCALMIERITNGIYATQYQARFQNDYSEFFTGSLEIDGEMISVNMGDYRYVFQ